MANGDRFFGPYGCSGANTGTGSAIFVQLDFAPQWVELFNTTAGGSLFWNKEMASDTGYLNSSSSVTLTPVVNENVTVMANFGTLANIPLIVQNVYNLVGPAAGPMLIIPDGSTPSPGQVAINLANGVMTFNGVDTVSSVRVSYATRSATGGGGGAFINTGGVTPGSNGFTIGTNATINTLGQNIVWNAGR